MDSRQIIMNFTFPPSIQDFETICESILDDLPEELIEYCADLEVVIEDEVDEATEIEMELDDPYELLVLYKCGKEISPGVEKKDAGDADILYVYRRSVLDMWCDTGEDFSMMLRQLMIEELGKRFDFTEDEVEEMTERHYQGMF